MTAIARMRTQGSLAASGQSANRIEGRSVDVSLSGTWTGTATLQRYMSDGWQDTEYSWTGITEATITFATPRQMRLNYTKVSGTLVYDLVASENVTGAVSLGLNSASGSGDATAANQVTQITDLGGVTETAPATDTASSGLNGRLQRIAQRLTSLIALLPTALGGGGGLKTEIFDSAGTEVNWSGITTVFRLLSAAGASQDSNNIKNAAGRIYSIIGINAVASIRYLKLYNKATAPSVGSDTPVMTLQLPASTSFAFDFPIGLAFSTGIGMGLVTAAADASSASVTAGDITCLNISYT